MSISTDIFPAVSKLSKVGGFTFMTFCAGILPVISSKISQVLSFNAITINILRS